MNFNIVSKLSKGCRPSFADEAERAMLDGVPLGSACWIMGYGHGQSELIRQGLQSDFPQPIITGIGAARISLKEYVTTTLVILPPNLQPSMTMGAPPQFRRSHGKRP
jgi:hypothetical protein